MMGSCQAAFARSSQTILTRHCERSEAIQRTGAGVLHRSANDNRPTRGLWIASSLARLAMTVLANDVRSSSPDMDCRVASGSSQ